MIIYYCKYKLNSNKNKKYFAPIRGCNYQKKHSYSCVSWIIVSCNYIKKHSYSCVFKKYAAVTIKKNIVTAAYLEKNMYICSVQPIPKSDGKTNRQKITNG